jgi:hypothetical protein
MEPPPASDLPPPQQQEAPATESPQLQSSTPMALHDADDVASFSIDSESSSGSGSGSGSSSSKSFSIGSGLLDKLQAAAGLIPMPNGFTRVQSAAKTKAQPKSNGKGSKDAAEEEGRAESNKRKRVEFELDDLDSDSDEDGGEPASKRARRTPRELPEFKSIIDFKHQLQDYCEFERDAEWFPIRKTIGYVKGASSSRSLKTGNVLFVC